ncbi:hypothetical protein [Haladaptatus sp. ZSTT2]|uniref:hypothetical protein n=1 Tax=Haladaptatus sp. ZSTT2 TaxID=3120515 RepID=UPI00300F65BC
MKRRAALKSLGGIALSNTLFGTANAASTKDGGLVDYEKYCKELVHRHGRIQDQDGAISRRGDVHIVDEMPEMGDVSKLYDPDLDLVSVEEQEFDDGTIIPQSLVSDDGSVIEIHIDDRLFKMGCAEVERVLNKRMRKAKEEIGLPHSISEFQDESNSPQTTMWSETSETDLVTSDVSAQSTTYWGFDDSYETSLSIPFLGGAYNDAGYDYANTAADASVAGYGSGYAQAWSSHQWSNGPLVINFKGEYDAAAWNALANSEIELQFYIKSNNQTIAQTYALKRSTFLGDYWHVVKEYEKGIYLSNPPSTFDVYMQGSSLAAAIGTSQTAISAADMPGGAHNGHFNLLNYQLIEV